MRSVALVYLTSLPNSRANTFASPRSEYSSGFSPWPLKSALNSSGGMYPSWLCTFLANLMALFQMVLSSLSSSGGSHFSALCKNTWYALSDMPYFFNTLPAKRLMVLLRLPSRIMPPKGICCRDASTSSSRSSASSSVSSMERNPSCQMMSSAVQAAPKKNRAASRALSSKKAYFFWTALFTAVYIAASLQTAMGNRI